MCDLDVDDGVDRHAAVCEARAALLREFGRADTATTAAMSATRAADGATAVDYAALAQRYAVFAEARDAGTRRGRVMGAALAALCALTRVLRSRHRRRGLDGGGDRDNKDDRERGCVRGCALLRDESEALVCMADAYAELYSGTPVPTREQWRRALRVHLRDCVVCHDDDKGCSSSSPVVGGEAARAHRGARSNSSGDVQLLQQHAEAAMSTSTADDNNDAAADDEEEEEENGAFVEEQLRQFARLCVRRARHGGGATTATTTRSAAHRHSSSGDDDDDDAEATRQAMRAMLTDVQSMLTSSEVTW